MADSVLAIQKGFEFQAKFFWYKACSLYRLGSTAVEINYEAGGVPGFDDVTISFNPPRSKKRYLFYLSNIIRTIPIKTLEKYILIVKFFIQ